MADGRARVVTGTAYEGLVLLYRQVQADHGLTPLAQSWSGLAIPRKLRPAADRFFRGDIALGMNMIPLAHDAGWHDMVELVAGVSQLAPDMLATAMLRPPDATRAEHERREREVLEVIAGRTPREPLIKALRDERFDISAAGALLDDPGAAAREFHQLLSGYARVVSRHDLLSRSIPRSRPHRPS